MINLDKNKKIEISEDITVYGETVPSTFQWITLDKQKQRARELDEMTKKKNERGDT